jgi:hypothetical protein
MTKSKCMFVYPFLVSKITCNLLTFTEDNWNFKFLFHGNSRASNFYLQYPISSFSVICLHTYIKCSYLFLVFIHK